MNIPGETWKSCLSTIFGVWLIVWIYASIHDQYLIRIFPPHFTVYHYRIPGITDYTLLALFYAFAASVTPGLLLGLCLYISGRLGNLPKKSVCTILTATACLAIATEIISLIVGLCAYLQKKGIYPASLYPDDSIGLGITQSIQLTAYFFGIIFSGMLIAWLGYSRLKESRRQAGSN